MDTPTYCSPLPMPHEIREHCHIFFDEQLYVHALNLLSDLVTAGASRSVNDKQAVIAPVPYHVELVSCLLIHPRYTSQVPEDERLDLASRSITYLRNLLTILGPVNANLVEAFSLSDPSTRGSRRRKYLPDHDGASSGSEAENKSDQMRGLIANQGRIKNCAKDFWHLVGWAFNCSVMHPNRWKYWKTWLSYMIDVLDTDWQDRHHIDMNEEDYRSQLALDPEAISPLHSVRKGLLIQYLLEVNGRLTPMKRVVRSAFADGSSDSLKEFPEVFHQETKIIKPKSQKRKRHDQFGDYDDEEELEEIPIEVSDAAGEVTERWGARDVKLEVGYTKGDVSLGDTEAMVLRQKIIMLLSRAAASFPEEFIGVRDLYGALYDCCRLLPLSAFSHLLCPSALSHLPIFVYVSFCQVIFDRLVPNSAPQAAIVSGLDDYRDELTQEIMEKCFFPFAAITTSVGDNAKLSIVMENLFRMMETIVPFEYRASLEDCVERGILAREKKVKKKIGAKKGKDEDEDMFWLTASGERLRLLVKLVKERSRSQA